MVENLPAMQETQVQFLSQEDSPGEGNGNPLQYSCLENSMDRGACPWNSPGMNTGVGCHSLLQGNLPDPGIKPLSPALQADSLPSEPPGKSRPRPTSGYFKGPV